MAIKNEPHEDMSLFKNRLYALMQSKDQDLNNARKLATELYEAGYELVDKRSENEPFKERSNAIESMKKIIHKHLSSDTSDCLQGKYIVAYCHFFGCSADYLLGFTSIRSADVDIRKMCEKIKLSEDAIISLIEITDERTAYRIARMPSEDIQKVLSRLFTTRGFLPFLRGLKELDDAYSKRNMEIRKIWNDLSLKIDGKFLDEAMKVDPYDTEVNADPKVCEVYKEISSAESDAFEIDEKYEYSILALRYELSEIYTHLIDEMFSGK